MTAGRVTVNGVVVTELGSKVDPTKDIVAVDGKTIIPDSSSTYLMLNKPTGYLTTMSDPHGRPTIAQLVTDADQPALFPVGRLDANTSGLLLFTTDGDLAYKLTHPKFELYKTYEATVKGTPDKAVVQALSDGVELEDGPTAPAHAAYSDGILTISIREGRNRQIRRMLEVVDHPVITLHRTHFGPLSLGSEEGAGVDALPKLAPGKWRPLTEGEIAALKESVLP
jgi:23S rRNA pseudouridine2605 synthase